MPTLNISISGDAESSASGKVTDPDVLQKAADIMRHLQNRAQTDTAAQGGTTPVA